MGKDSHNRLNNYGVGYTVFTIANYMVLFLLVLVTLLPYLHIFAKAFNDGNDTMRGGILFWPREFTMNNFVILFKDPGIFSAIGVTISRLILGLFLGIVVQFTAAYGLSRKGMPFRKAITIYFIIPMYISGGIIPTYILYSKMHLLNNFFVYVLPGLFIMNHVIIIRSYMNSSIPDSLIEAAYIDGAKELTVFTKVVLPLCKPILATVVLWIAVNHWNDWTTTLYFVRNSKLHTLMYKLMQLLKESERYAQMMFEAAKSGNISKEANNFVTTPESVISAQVVITTLPIIMVYPFLQKYFINGVVLGAVKE